MNLREFFFENFAGDLEYHPRRAALYLVLAIAAAAAWFFSPAETKFTTTPLVFALGGLTLLAKGLFLLRRSSEGPGLSQSDLAALSTPASRKQLPSIPTQAAQILQVRVAASSSRHPLFFFRGSELQLRHKPPPQQWASAPETTPLWPLLNAGKDIDQSWSDPPRLQVFASGALLFALGWTIRCLTTATQ